MLGTPFFLIFSFDSNYDPVCGGGHGMDQQAGRDYLIGVACASAGTLLTAAGAALQGRGRDALIVLGLGAAVVVALAATGVISAEWIREAAQVATHPPPWQPGVMPDRFGICRPR